MSSDDWDQCFKALCHPCRRRLVVTLLEQNEGVVVPEEVHVGEQPLKELHTELHHKHLPRLKEWGFIDWNKGANHVEKGEDFSEIQPMVEVLHDNRESLPDGWV